MCVAGDEEGIMKRLEAIQMQIQHVKEVLLREHANAAREEKFIKWERPQEGWWKMNVACGGTAIAGAGGVLRDSWGRWRMGSQLNIGLA